MKTALLIFLNGYVIIIIPISTGNAAIAIANEPKLYKKSKEPKPTASKLSFNALVYSIFV